MSSLTTLQRFSLGTVKLNRRTATVVLTVVLAFALLTVLFLGWSITDQQVGPDFSRKSLPPSWQYPFGTDWLGRNMLLRTIKGLSLSISVGALAAAVSAVIATIMGILAATGGKAVDKAILWLIDLVMGVPHIVLLILISFALGGGVKGMVVGIAATHWPSLARVVRAEALQVRGEPYIQVSRHLGHGRFWILFHHILPHALPQFMVGIILLFPHAILHEAALSFLGFGFPPEQPAIGIILADSMKYLVGGMWWLAVFPGVSLLLVVLAFDKLGDNLRTMVDPSTAQN